MIGFNFLILMLTLYSTLACEYKKYGADHTMCKYPGPGCKIDKHGLSSTDKDIAVKIHNQLRQKVANGQPGQPKASNMKELKWDEELAKIAQQWADQCHFGHDKNRRSHKFEKVGQNVYITKSTAPSDDVPLEDAATDWYNEVTDPGFNKNHIQPFQYVKGVGHYTQLAWANTETVGCGYSYYQQNDKFRYVKLIVCNYGPSGNVRDGQMYQVGEPCSKCSNGCSKTYSGLCN